MSPGAFVLGFATFCGLIVISVIGIGLADLRRQRKPLPPPSMQDYRNAHALARWARSYHERRGSSARWLA